MATPEMVPVGHEAIPVPTWPPLQFRTRLVALLSISAGIPVQKYNRRHQAGVKNLFGEIHGDDLRLFYRPTNKDGPGAEYLARQIWRIDVGPEAKNKWMADSDLSDGEAKSLIVITFKTEVAATTGPQWRVRCQTTAVCRELVQLLSFFVALGRSVESVPVVLSTIIRVWFAADEDFSGGITSEELLAGFRKCNIAADAGFVTELFNTFDSNDNDAEAGVSPLILLGGSIREDDAASVKPTTVAASSVAGGHVPRLDFHEFTELARGLFATPAPAVSRMIDTFAESSNQKAMGETTATVEDSKRKSEVLLTVDELARFFTEAQGEPISANVAMLRMKTINGGRSSTQLSGDDFFAYLLNPKLNSWVCPEHEHVYMDMTQPLHHYFIASSAYSALNIVDETPEGAPVFSSSTDWLLAAMAQGVRAVDIQFAENDELSLPCVVEADGASVSTTSIVDVLKAVATHAFETSPFPLILHLDLRTTTNGSAVVKQELKRHLGEHLLTQEDIAKMRRSGLTLSPSNLIHKVLVSTCIDDKTAVAIHASMPEDSPSRAIAAGVGLHCLHKVVALPVLVHDKVGWGASSEETDVAIVHRHELVGGTQDTVCGSDRRHRKWAENTRKSLLYLRPSAPTSANPCLEQTMRHGLQFAGMNIPLGDEVGREYEQLFQSINGGCGYILKPPSMRLVRRAPDDTTFRFSVAVIQGMHMPRPPDIETNADPMDLSVRPGQNALSPVLVRTSPQQRDMGKGRFKVTLNFSGCDDVETDPGTFFEWNQTSESLSYCPTFDSITTGPRDARIRGVELGVVTFRLHFTAGVTSVPVAEATLPVRSLRVGYRAVALFAADTNRPLQASLLCHFGMLRI